MVLKDADDLVYPAVRRTLAALDLGPQDAAAAKCAERIAANIDATTDGVYAMRWLAPELLRYLVELGATPAARAAIRKMTGERPEDAEDVLSRLPVRRRGA